VSNLFQYYWIINPLKTSIKNSTCSTVKVLSSDEVIHGKSPLGEDGEIFYQMVHSNVSLYDHCLWVFSNELYESQDKANEYSRYLKIVGEALFDFQVSLPGFIVSDSKTKEVTCKQPPQGKIIESCALNKVEEDDLNRLITLSNTIYSLSPEHSEYFLSIFDYLRDIRLSPLFVGELALWSFIEHHWADKKNEKTKIEKSIKNFLEYVCKTNEQKKDLNKRIKKVGQDLGHEYNEHILRNVLAHGKHFTLQERWTEDNWNNFYDIHKQLFQLVTTGIEKQVYEIKEQ